MIIARFPYVVLRELDTTEEHSFTREDGTKVSFVTDFMRSGQKLRGDGPFEAEVVSAPYKLPSLKAGDKVLYDAYSGGYELQIDGEYYFITKWPNIWGVLE